jgi:hypothetical protein
MITIFKKIRKKMADDNKPIQYARYAMGEIVLVVIGILIALQVNNWNEKQKQNAEFEIVLEQFYNAVKNDTEIFNSFENRINDQIQVIDELLIRPDSIANEALPHILGYLTVEDVNSYSSETEHHISNLKYNINNPKQNELSKQITTYVNSINEKIDYIHVERINPLFYDLEIPEAIWNYNDFGGINEFENDNYYSETDYEKLHVLVRSPKFRAILKTLKSYKLLYKAHVSNNYEDGLSIMKLIKTYYPDVKLLYQDVGIIGTAINGYDDVGAKSTPLIQTDIENSIWELDLYLKKGTVKFRCRDSWNQNWGGDTFPKGNAQPDGENIFITAGTYHVILNLSKNTYEFIKLDDKLNKPTN